MTRAERFKKIQTAVAAAVVNPLVAEDFAVGLAAMEEELRSQAARLAALEIAFFGKESHDV